MGERSYNVLGRDGTEYNILFSTEDDDFGCLCTFPANDGKRLTRGRVRELALVGAAVVLAAFDAQMLRTYGEEDDQWVPLPGGLPDWIPAEILHVLPPDEDDEEVTG